MSDSNKFFEDFNKLVGSAMGTAFNSAAELKNQFDEQIRMQIEAIVAKNNLVTREEFSAVKEMAVNLKAENDSLKKEIEKLKKSKK